MTDDTANHARNQAIAVLAISTAVLGFGLFSVEFRGMAAMVEDKGFSKGIVHAALVFALAVTAFAIYLVLIASVSAILRKPDASSFDVANGPLAHLILIASFVGFVLLLNSL